MADSPETEHGEHLLPNRPQILLRSLLIGAAGFIPVPPLSDYLTEALRRGLLRHVAQARQVDIDEPALDILVAPDGEQRLGAVAKVAGFISMLRPLRWSRRLLGATLLVSQADESLRAFQQATLLDHYFAKHHQGPAIDATRAQALRVSIEAVGRSTRREVAGETFEQALSLAQRALSAVPRRLLGGKGAEPDAPAAPPESVVLIADVQTQRLVRDVGLHRYGRRLANAFDRSWSRSKEPG